MDWLAGDFLSALVAIVIIDLVLAGDNAIVIALAARNLPVNLRKRAIVWGTFGAIVVRTTMTLVVVWLLKVPGLLLIGGSLLVWIAYKLVVDEPDGATRGLDPAKNFWDAMKTIIVADALMGLDNVLAVAGAAQGSFLLVLTGLLISIPIVIWGSQFILKLVGRYPGIIYLGAGVLAWTAVKMIAGEPLLQDLLAQHPLMTWLAYIAVIGGVIGSGLMINYDKVRRRVAAHLADVLIGPGAASADTGISRGDTNMYKVLVPVDGSANSLKAVRHVVNRFMDNRALQVHVLHVRTPLSQHVARFVSRRNREAYHREEAQKALQASCSLLEQFSVPYFVHVELGDKALTIERMAQRLEVNQIVMGTARKNSFTRMIEDSVTNKVLELTQVPVEVVAGQSISKLERIGIPAAVGALLALLYAAAD